MLTRILLLLAMLLATEAFAPRLTFMPSAPSTTSTTLEASRMNAKKEKLKRNRENMRKFKKGGRKGLSRRKMLRKAQASKARQEESEFITKCFTIVTAPTTREDSSDMLDSI
ncbi:hypothetical protein MPSEU_000656800 [Mayamaea pseudoterrestris]|nr:hypothetical protein MPSEU_000656800 [Mayamaea pseudoterrestris]